MALVRPHVKWAASVRASAIWHRRWSGRSSKPRRAFRGPVFVECPVDLLYPEATVRGVVLRRRAAAAPPAASAPFGGTCERHLNGVFAPARRRGSIAEPVREPGPAPDDVRSAARLVAAASRPVLVVGSQAVTGAEVVGLAVGDRGAGNPGLPVRNGARPARVGPTHCSSATSASRRCARPTSSFSRARRTTSGSITGGRCHGPPRSSP